MEVCHRLLEGVGRLVFVGRQLDQAIGTTSSVEDGMRNVAVKEDVTTKDTKSKRRMGTLKRPFVDFLSCPSCSSWCSWCSWGWGSWCSAAAGGRHCTGYQPQMTRRE